MASSVETVPTILTPPQPNMSTSRTRGGYRGGSRNGNRGKNRNPNGEDSQELGQQEIGPQDKSRGGRRGRGSRGIHAGETQNQSQLQRLDPLNHRVPPLDPPPGQGGGGSFGDRLTKDAGKVEGEARGNEEIDEEDIEAEVCFICASPVVHISVAPCNHRTCHICALRLRALYKTRACAHCRVSRSGRSYIEHS